MLVDIDTRAVDCYSLGKGARGCLYPFAASQAVLLASIALQLAAAQLFAEIQPMDSAAQQLNSSIIQW